MRTVVKSPNYSTSQIARLVGVHENRIREFVRMGFVTPKRGSGRRFHFSFGDILLLREAKQLIEDGISPRKVRHSLRRLEEQLPGKRPLTAVNLRAEDGHVVAVEGSGKWRADSGQFLLSFEPVRSGSLQSASPDSEDKRFRSVGMEDSAEKWFEKGLQAESNDLGEALVFYQKALTINPRHLDAHLNRGRILHEKGELAQAETHYRQALRLRPSHVIAHYNLGVVMEDLGRIEDAVEAYENALESDSSFREAHFNLARIFDSVGDSAGALQHLKAFRKLGRP